MHKILVLGLDGGSLDLVKRWKDELPNLRRFMEGGVYGTLESTLPPTTSPAWNCMFTGKNPAKIGIFSFVVFDKEKKPQLVNITCQDSPSLWDILSSHNLKVGVVSVPTVYPPVKVNGFVVCGGMLAVDAKNCTFPPGLKEELDEVLEGAKIALPAGLNMAGWEDKYSEAYDAFFNNQNKMVNYLIREYPWDLFIYVFFTLDAVQHYFWAHMDPNHPQHDPIKAKKYGDTIKGFYKKIDNEIGEIMCRIGDNVNIIVVSDHGFGPCYGHFNLNDWLKKNGFLAFKKQGIKSLFAQKTISLTSFILSNLDKRIAHSLEAVLWVVPSAFLEYFGFKEKQKRQRIQLFENLDWSLTKVYEAGGGIYINKRKAMSKKEYEELRHQIIQMLDKIRDPKTGRKVMINVFKKEEIYNGKYMEEAPDILYLSNFHRESLIHGQVTGWHRLNGMFMAYGPDIKKTGNELENIKIYDIVPTVLHLFGLPIPEDVDGRVLEEIFKEDSEPAKKRIAYQRMHETRLDKGTKVFADEDEEKIKESLRRLGYI